MIKELEFFHDHDFFFSSFYYRNNNGDGITVLALELIKKYLVIKIGSHQIPWL